MLIFAGVAVGLFWLIPPLTIALSVIVLKRRRNQLALIDYYAVYFQPDGYPRSDRDALDASRTLAIIALALSIVAAIGWTLLIVMTTINSPESWTR